MKNTIMVMNTLLIPSLLFGTEPNFTIHFPQEPINHSIVYLSSHGLGATQSQALSLLPENNKYWILNKPLAVFDFPDAKPNHMEYDTRQVNLGQQADIDRLRYAYYKTRQELPNHGIVLTGISRGAVTALNCMALHNLDNILAMVLESPFDTFNNVVKHLLRRFHIGWIPFSRKLAIRYIKKTFPTFDINGIFPINVAHMIPLNMPILLVHAQTDRTIPIKSSRLIYCALLASGHTNVYLLELEEGNHGKLITGPNGEIFQNVTHAFYKKYNLPHNPLFAQQGEELLKRCQPSLHDMKKYMKKLKKIIKKMKKNNIETIDI